MVRINLARQDLTAGYRPGYSRLRPKNQQEIKLLIYKLLTIAFFMWAMLIHLSSADKYYQTLVLGAAMALYLNYLHELHRE